MKKRLCFVCLAVLALAAVSCGKAEPENPFYAVDLGLSVKWASCNLGAVNEYEEGDAFAWGDTKPKDSETVQEWASYKYFKSKRTEGSETVYSFSKYDDDGKTVLDPEDDAAHVILGGAWRMPTIKEWEELVDNCTLTEEMVHGTVGIRATSKKNSNSIFIPDYGSYWSATRLPKKNKYAWCCRKDFSWHVETDYVSRCYYICIRPVSE